MPKQAISHQPSVHNRGRSSTAANRALDVSSRDFHEAVDLPTPAQAEFSEPHAVDRVMEALRASRRYGGIDEAVLRRLALESLVATGGVGNAAIKRAKRCLHQIVGACLPTPPPYDRLLVALQSAGANGPDAVRQALRRAMSYHASSRERLAILEAFYSRLWAELGRPRSVLDIACGLNPLAVPWMGLADDIHYRATDIDLPMLAFVSSSLTFLGVRHTVETADALSFVPPHAAEADVTLALKLLPCLESQRAGSGLDLLRRLRSPAIVVSFPTHSLGGHGKGMRTTYARRFEEDLARECWQLRRFDFPSELVYIVRKPPREC